MNPRILISVGLAAALTTVVSCNDTRDPVSASRLVPGAASRNVVIPSAVLGVDTHIAEDGNGDIGRDLDDLNSGTGKINFIRVDIPWYDWEWRHSQGDTYYNWSFSQIAPHGVQVLATLSYRYARSWENGTHIPTGDAEFDHCANRDARMCVPDGTADPSDHDAWDTFFADWQTFVNSVVTENAAYVKYWESWNEPEPDGFGSGGGHPGWFNGRDWQVDSLGAAMCRIVHANGLVCVGPAAGLHDGDPSGTQVGTDVTWVENRANAANDDIISVHLYRPSSEIATIAARFTGRGSKKLWVDETGHISPNIAQPAHDPELQERGVYDKVTSYFNGQIPGVDGIFLFDLQSVAGGMDENFAYKRGAYYALKKIISGTYTPPADGFCSTATGSNLCDFVTDTFSLDSTPVTYTGLLTVRAVDQTRAAVAGLSVTVSYSDTAIIGTKRTSASTGAATFRVDRHQPYYTVTIAGMPDATFAVAPLGASSYSSITFPDGSGALQTHYRTFMLAHGTCTMRAELTDSNGNPVVGAVVEAYQGSQALGQYTTSSGGLTPLVSGDCKFLHGFGIVSLPLEGRQRGAADPSSIGDRPLRRNLGLHAGRSATCCKSSAGEVHDHVSVTAQHPGTSAARWKTERWM